MSIGREGEAGPDPEHDAGLLRRAVRFARAHRHMMFMLIGGALLGAIVAAFLPMGEVTLVRRVLGGAVAGFYFGLFPLGFRMLE